VSIINRADALKWLKHYGYADTINQAGQADTVKRFQRAHGLKADGDLGEKCRKFMSSPRCGCTDNPRVAKQQAEFLWSNSAVAVVTASTDLAERWRGRMLAAG